MDILKEALLGCLQMMKTIILIVVPLMIVLEMLKASDIFQRVSIPLKPAFKRLKLSPEALFPWLVGLVFGVTYGAGVLMQVGKEGRLSEVEIKTVGLFLGLCHAIFEDTLLFVVLGASWLWLVFGRIILAFGVTWAVRRWI